MAAKTGKKKKPGAANGVRDAWTVTMLERSDQAFSFDTEQRQRVIDDMKFTFVSGNQWDQHLTSKRRNKPCYEFNRMRQLVRRITGQQLKNKPQIKVRAVEDNDVDTAEVYNGLIKNIEVQSSAENAYDTAMQWACGGGYGILRVKSAYEGPDTFDQRLEIVNVMDPMTCWCDPAARKFDRSDARFWFVTELIPKEEFKARWPNAPVIDFEAPNAVDQYQDNWLYEDAIQIAEYWYKEPETKKIYLLTDGSVVDAEKFDPVRDEFAAGIGPDGSQFPPVTVKSERVVEVDCVYSCLVTACGKLDEPVKWGGTMIPIVPQWGDLVAIDGKQIYSGMTRFGRDAQTIHNFEMSSTVEVVAKLPNMPLMATPAMIKGLESYYERMGYDDPPVMLYNADPAAPGGQPNRQPMAQLPTALVSLSQIATDELKANLGVYDASLGARTNETSGRAIIARQAEGEVANFVYVDNQVKALKRLGEILVDAIPHYYDAERSIRILGEDNAEKFVKINQVMVDQQTGEEVVVNDLSRGRYDVTVTVGKSFDTARMELAEAAQALSQQQGPIGMLGQFMMLKSLDVPGMDEFVKAARKLLVGQGLLEPNEGEQGPPPPQPNPKDVSQAEKDKATAAKYQAETEGINLENTRKAAELAVFGVPYGPDGQSPTLAQPPAEGPPPGMQGPGQMPGIVPAGFNGQAPGGMPI